MRRIRVNGFMIFNRNTRARTAPDTMIPANITNPKTRFCAWFCTWCMCPPIGSFSGLQFSVSSAKTVAVKSATCCSSVSNLVLAETRCLLCTSWAGTVKAPVAKSPWSIRWAWARAHRPARGLSSLDIEKLIYWLSNSGRTRHRVDSPRMRRALNGRCSSLERKPSITSVLPSSHSCLVSSSSNSLP
jgi:hypothetical protein